METGLPAQTARLAESMTNPGGRRHFVRVTVDSAGRIRSAGAQGSHCLSSLAAANGLVDVPPKNHSFSGCRGARASLGVMEAVGCGQQRSETRLPLSVPTSGARTCAVGKHPRSGGRLRSGGSFDELRLSIPNAAAVGSA